MPFIPPETIEKARQVDLLTYLKACEPNELVHISGDHYCTCEHDSLKISNGKWYWFSRGFGGYNALDYLIKVKEVPFMEAVERITGQVAYQPRQSQPKQEKPKVLLLPQANRSTSRVHSHLRSRGIDSDLIDFCIQTGRLYESAPHHNAVFVGLDKLYLYTAIAPVPLSAFAGEPTQSIGISFIKSYAAVCLEGAIIVLGCIIFSLFAASPPVVDPNAAAVSMVWSYVDSLNAGFLYNGFNL